MSFCLGKLNQRLKKYDSLLYATKNPLGNICIMRKASNIEFVCDDLPSLPRDHFIFALTTNLQAHGDKIDLGWEKIYEILTEMDWQVRQREYEKMVKRRELKKELKKREFSNNVRGLAADIRKDFAKATNDIVVREDNKRNLAC